MSDRLPASRPADRRASTWREPLLPEEWLSLSPEAQARIRAVEASTDRGLARLRPLIRADFAAR